MMPSPSPSAAGVPHAEKLYMIAGETGDKLNLLALRDRIRGGLLQRDQQIAIVGTDLWKPAWQYPPLERYFALTEEAAAKQAPAGVAPAGPMGARIVRGLAYPFTNIAGIAFIAAAAFTTPIAIVSAVVSFAAMAYALA